MKRTYTDDELDQVFRRQPLISEEELLAMWPITKRKLRELQAGRHPSGVHLPAVKFSGKQRAFRPADVARVQRALLDR